MYKGRNIYLCAFANIEFMPSIIRFHNQAKESNFFDNIFIYNEYNLPKDEKFEALLSHKLVPSRGFGYWCWKPFIILKTLENIKDGDILVYADIGCHINKDFIIKLYLRNKMNAFIKSNNIEIKNFINEMQNINLI